MVSIVGGKMDATMLLFLQLLQLELENPDWQKIKDAWQETDNFYIHVTYT